MAPNLFPLETTQALLVALNARDVGDPRDVRSVQEKGVDVDALPLLRPQGADKDSVFEQVKCHGTKRPSRVRAT